MSRRQRTISAAPQLVERSRQWYDIIHLALQTDSTRVISLWLSSQERPDIDGVNLVHHDASHHGQDPSKLEQLALIEEAELRTLGEFLDKMKKSTEGERTLLDRTAIFYASNLGNASSHDNNNLPILLAGGGFKHQGHVAYDRKNNTLLSNLFVRMLHQMGIEAKSFGASTGSSPRCADGHASPGVRLCGPRVRKASPLDLRVAILSFQEL